MSDEKQLHIEWLCRLGLYETSYIIYGEGLNITPGVIDRTPERIDSLEEYFNYKGNRAWRWGF